MANWTNSTLSNGIMAQTINLSGLTSSIGSLTMGDPNDLLAWDNQQHVKKYQVFEIDEDLLALSSTWKRLRDEHKRTGIYHGISKLTEKELFQKVTDDDREHANVIRDYYSKKIVMWKLKGQQLSRFREDMNSFIHTNGKVFKENACPMVYRLPEFYEYDIGFEALANKHSKVIKNDTDTKTEKKLTYCETFLVGNRVNRKKEFWFNDENDNLVTLSVRADNELVSLLEKYVTTNPTLKGKFSKRTRENIDYFVTEKYTF